MLAWDAAKQERRNDASRCYRDPVVPRQRPCVERGVALLQRRGGSIFRTDANTSREPCPRSPASDQARSSVERKRSSVRALFSTANSNLQPSARRGSYEGRTIQEFDRHLHGERQASRLEH